MTCHNCFKGEKGIQECSMCLIGLDIRCQTTCGCGNPLVRYDKQRPQEGYVLLTCRAFDGYDHPSLIRVRIPEEKHA